jgi:hypothetical protein
MQEQDLYTDRDEEYKNTPVDSPIPPPTFEQFRHILQGSNENRNNKQQKTYPNQSPGKSYSNSNDSRNYNRSHNNNNNKSMSSAMPSIFSQAQQQPPPKPASKPVSANSQKDFVLNDKTMAAVQRHIKK